MIKGINSSHWVTRMQAALVIHKIVKIIKIKGFVLVHYCLLLRGWIIKL